MRNRRDFSSALSPGHPAGRDDSLARCTIKDVQLILASQVPLHWAYWMRDDRKLCCVSDLCGDADGCCAHAEIPSGTVVSNDSSS